MNIKKKLEERKNFKWIPGVGPYKERFTLYLHSQLKFHLTYKRRFLLFGIFFEEGKLPKFIDKRELKRALKRGAYSDEMYSLMRKCGIIK